MLFLNLLSFSIDVEREAMAVRSTAGCQIALSPFSRTFPIISRRFDPSIASTTSRLTSPITQDKVLAVIREGKATQNHRPRDEYRVLFACEKV